VLLPHPAGPITSCAYRMLKGNLKKNFAKKFENLAAALSLDE
jgi:hypothetical protein